MELDKLICGECVAVMKTFPSESVDCIVTDPPYGYSFMGKHWDKAVPAVEVWRESLRVLKSGAFMFVMSSPRQDVLSQMIVRLGQAGFEIGFTSIYWAYASGFPKAMNVSKAVDKRLGVERKITGTRVSAFGDAELSETEDDRNLWGKPSTTELQLKDKCASEEAKVLDGSYGGFQPKPAVEVIIVCMKPLSEKTFVDQALANGKGVTWLDDCRIPFEINQDFDEAVKAHREADVAYKQDGRKTVIPSGGSVSRPEGRFPANLLVSDDVLNDGRNSKGSSGNNEAEVGVEGNIPFRRGRAPLYCDSGGFSRYFALDAWWNKTVGNLPEGVRKTFPFLICPKASKSERNQGCEQLENHVGGGMKGTEDLSLKTGSGNIRNNIMKNFHPTVKPLRLMSYLVTLGSREGDVVLDPFVGSGTTCLAAKMLNRKWIGIDVSKEYCGIASARLGGVEVVEPQEAPKSSTVEPPHTVEKNKCVYVGRCSYRLENGTCTFTRSCKERGV